MKQIRWKINSIGYGDRILRLIGILTIAVPLSLYLCSWILGLFRIKDPGILFFAIKISFTSGMVVLALFVLLLAIEFVQDHRLDASYLKTRGQKLRLANGQYECQYCGSQKVRWTDKQCPVCGKDLQ